MSPFFKKPQATPTQPVKYNGLTIPDPETWDKWTRGVTIRSSEQWKKIKSAYTEFYNTRDEASKNKLRVLLHKWMEEHTFNIPKADGGYDTVFRTDRNEVAIQATKDLLDANLRPDYSEKELHIIEFITKAQKIAVFQTLTGQKIVCNTFQDKLDKLKEKIRNYKQSLSSWTRSSVPEGSHIGGCSVSTQRSSSPILNSQATAQISLAYQAANHPVPLPEGLAQEMAAPFSEPASFIHTIVEKACRLSDASQFVSEIVAELQQQFWNVAGSNIADLALSSIPGISHVHGIGKFCVSCYQTLDAYNTSVAVTSGATYVVNPDLKSAINVLGEVVKGNFKSAAWSTAQEGALSAIKAIPIDAGITGTVLSAVKAYAELVQSIYSYVCDSINIRKANLILQRLNPSNQEFLWIMEQLPFVAAYVITRVPSGYLLSILDSEHRNPFYDTMVKDLNRKLEPIKKAAHDLIQKSNYHIRINEVELKHRVNEELKKIWDEVRATQSQEQIKTGQLDPSQVERSVSALEEFSEIAPAAAIVVTIEDAERDQTVRDTETMLEQISDTPLQDDNATEATNKIDLFAFKNELADRIDKYNKERSKLLFKYQSTKSSQAISKFEELIKSDNLTQLHSFYLYVIGKEKNCPVVGYTAGTINQTAMQGTEARLYSYIKDLVNRYPHK